MTVGATATALRLSLCCSHGCHWEPHWHRLRTVAVAPTVIEAGGDWPSLSWVAACLTHRQLPCMAGSSLQALLMTDHSVEAMQKAGKCYKSQGSIPLKVLERL